MAVSAPPFVSPMLLWPTDRLPDGKEWWSEPKLDGCRGQLRVADGSVQLRSRPGRRCEREFPEVAAAAAAHPALTDAVLDGELVSFDGNGRPDFHALRERLGTSERTAAELARVCPVRFVVFDVMWLDGKDLRSRPLTERRRRLEALDLHGVALQTVVSAPGCASVIVQFAREHELEGVVAKRGSSVYSSGRSRTWLKYKLRRSELVWVTAWTPGDRGRPDRYWVARELDGRLRLCGDVSFGLAPDQRERLRHEVGRREIGAARRGGLRPVKLGVRVRVEAHGRPDGPLRDPVIRSVELPGRPRVVA